jgi:uncharacterized protein YdiU (UPF0061 family)
VGLWNLQRLAQTLSPFISAEALNARWMSISTPADRLWPADAR